MDENTQRLLVAQAELAQAQKELAWEVAKTAVDVAGLVDPTPISDLTGAAMSASDGDWKGAGLSLISVVPYLGDAVGKPLKGARAAAKIAKLEKKVAALTQKVNSLSKPVKEAIENVGKKAAKSADEAKCVEKCPTSKPNRLIPNTPEHKAARWKEYVEREGKWSYERWSKQYDTNMANATHGLEREKLYRSTFGGTSETLKTPFTNRQIDIFQSDKMYAGQLKTGKVGLTDQAKIDIQKDAYLVDQGYKVEYILEKGASKNLLKALDAAGIDVILKPKIP